MVEGKFIEGNRPMVPALIAWGQAIQNPYFILDTGFTGDLQVTPQIAKDLGLELNTVTNAQIATGEIVPVRSGVAFAVMGEEKIYVTVLVSEGMPLLGISFLEKFKYKAIVDCKNKTVQLEVVN